MTDATEVRMTLNYVLDSSCSKYGDTPAIGMALEPALTYNEVHARVIALAYRMQREGVGKGDRIAILAENSHNWGIAYFAAVRLGAVVVPLLPDLPESDVRHILGEMQVKILFTTQRQVDKIVELKSGGPGRIITLDDHVPDLELLAVVTYADYLAGAQTILAESAELPVFSDVDQDDLAAILYTSGTSGYSKAVMLSHKNLTSNAYAASGLMAIPPGSVFLSILPMSHTYEFTCGFILPLITGSRIAYAGKSPTPAILQKFCQHEKPLVIFAVPLVLEKIYKKRVLPQIGKSRLLTMLCKTSFGRRLIHRKIGLKLLDFFGGNLKLMGIGGAALNPEVETFLAEAKFPYLVGYGLTESSPLLAGGPAGDATITVGSTGKPLPGVKIRIADPAADTGIGEICACGPNIMLGYYNDGEATAEVLSPDGWLATGDLGFIDDAGNLHVCGRSKNVIVLPNGENVYPEAIEHKINSYNWVVEGLVLENNGRLEAWIYPDYEVIDEETAGRSRAERREYIDGRLESTRRELNEQLPSASRITKIFERREPFVKTATHKIKRYLYDSHSSLG
ncbi:AMP-binding protein [Desulfoprunum benzoelyticum]|uniref:Long-chain acyl-CoA synthetase n=1 Tax=Desulfoprunum benzoelyticum TaxID=1506996 RepID=A0A840V080_9BACT|nr:AMP-binding protein [Desulfoprunum benzoelyticum]MBB5347119.1 long-chain acyl-CoA synthetase [Desulfoprunum benzoelyticum]MBM9531246.1 AMP-binding protein [Desulfoprunum benzoelyticum]